MPLIEICPVIPAALSRLPELAANLAFSWHRPTRALFEDLDGALWRQTGANPRLLLRCVDQPVLERAARDADYLRRYHEALAVLDAYLAVPARGGDEPLVAYFCAEYGFHESFPIYSGGLGILAGDHCKSASDEGLRFLAVGLLYRQGYFTQSVDSDGAQTPLYRDADPRDLPVERVDDAQGQWLVVEIPIGRRQVLARVWRAQVGRVSVYLLDTNVPSNAPTDRDITFRLYGGDEGVRIRQEMVLGIGGLRVLRALGLAPDVLHLNEGHAAFAIFEQLRELRAAGLALDVALEAAAARTVFTTHTPVAAGHDAFHDALFSEHFEGFAAAMGEPVERLLGLGRVPGVHGLFNMTRLALQGARRVNGVSRIHGGVSARLCADHWPQLVAEENPVGYVTNGVHLPTFMANPWTPLLDEAVPGWREGQLDESTWSRVEQLPAARFWATAQDIKSRMLHAVQGRLAREFRRKGMSPAQLRRVTRHLDPAQPDVLTLGFARRFATYKRASLVLRDRERLLRLVSDPQRPVLFLFAGKAHPADYPGQQVLREIKQLMVSPEFAGKVVFLEDYDIQLARSLVTGVDVWLNNPVAPLEASGTSGMKAAINGRLNLSILDGWWAEAFDGGNGWGVPGADVQDEQRRDQLDADAVLDVLEDEVVPLYYTRDTAGLPQEWIRRARHAMASVAPRFDMRRAVRDYRAGLYGPAALQGRRLLADQAAGAVALAAWKQRVRAAWPGVQLQAVHEVSRAAGVGVPVRLEVAVQLNGLRPQDVIVELKAQRRLPESSFEPAALCSYGHALPSDQWRPAFEPTERRTEEGATIYQLSSVPPGAGQYQAQYRVFPHHPLLSHPLELGLIKTL
jgi:glycogen phosphorylase